ncbi:MAG: hypothetical protein Q9182_005104 [Xanthomendoza sp. 2 TL-2023]
MGERTSDSIPGLPNELLKSIFRFSDRSDLLKIRSCSRTFNQIANVLLFETIIITTDQVVDQDAQCPTRLHEDYTKELRFSVIGYSTQKFEDPYFSDNDGKTIKAGTRPSHIVPILSMNNLRKVLFTNESRNPPLRRWYGYPTSYLHTKSTYLYGLPAEPITLSFRVLLVTLYFKKVPVTQLIARTNYSWRFMLQPDVFDVDQPFLNQIESVFSNLTKLHLDLDAGHEFAVRLPLVTNFPRIMRQATRLEHLSIDLVREDLARGPGHPRRTWRRLLDFEGILHGCIFPKLRTCLLFGFPCRIADIRSFIHGCPDLQELCLEACQLLQKDCWEEAVTILKETLRALKYVQIAYCCGKLGLDNPDDMLNDVYSYVLPEGEGVRSDDDPHGAEQMPYGNKYGLVQDFFFRGGPNPFGAEGRALERAKFVRNAEGVVIPGWLERMQRVHGFVEDDPPDFGPWE